MAKQRVRLFVTGKVQGVFYRANTQQKAIELNITGWVRNLSDGSVEVLACGEAQQVANLVSWLHKGPPAASVTQVATKTLPWQDYSDFAIIG